MTEKLPRYRNSLPKYQVVIMGEPNRPESFFLTARKSAPVYYNGIGIKQAYAINWQEERINFTDDEIQLMKGWDIALNWKRCLVIDTTIHSGGRPNEVSELEHNLAGFDKTMAIAN